MMISIRYNTKSDEMKRLQIKLKEFGFPPADIDATGWFGLITLKAVKDFQKAKGIIQTDFVEPFNQRRTE